MTMLGSEGFEYEGEEYTVTLRFDSEGTYEGVDFLQHITYPPVQGGEAVCMTPVSHNEATAIWWGLTEQQRDVLHQRCLEDAQLSRQADDGDSVWACF